MFKQVNPDIHAGVLGLSAMCVWTFSYVCLDIQAGVSGRAIIHVEKTSRLRTACIPFVKITKLFCCYFRMLYKNTNFAKLLQKTIRNKII